MVAPWLADRTQRGQAARWALGFARHWALFHLARSPIYLLKLIGYSPTGAMRVLRGVVRWITDAQSGPLRAAAVRDELYSEYDKLQSRRDLRVKVRGGILAVAVAAVWIAYVTVLAEQMPSWAPPVVLSVLVLALGYHGRPVDKPIAMTAVVIPRVQPLTSEIVVRALGSLGIAALNQAAAKNPTGKGWFVAPGIGRDGPGWRVDLELPYGVTATDIIDKRDRLASGLRRPLGCVWPEPAPEHPGRVVLWCGDQDMSQAKQPAWPLARSGQVDLFVPNRLAPISVAG
ncbi:MAG TPA: cell division protein FtsK, partial [Pseudonocardiaceae bacterium]|nr:cell division protein FtsK [Pseudonocardiaceae bacterium]